MSIQILWVGLPDKIGSRQWRIQIRELGERGGHPDPETRGGKLKRKFSAFRASASSKNKGGPSVHRVYIVTLLDHEVMNV